jgi:hypothetical protein
MMSLYEQALKAVQTTEKRISAAQEKVSFFSRELADLGHRYAAERRALDALEKGGK